jgi:hypothetical protein
LWKSALFLDKLILSSKSFLLIGLIDRSASFWYFAWRKSAQRVAAGLPLTTKLRMIRFAGGKSG